MQKRVIGVLLPTPLMDKKLYLGELNGLAQAMGLALLKIASPVRIPEKQRRKNMEIDYENTIYITKVANGFQVREIPVNYGRHKATYVFNTVGQVLKWIEKYYTKDISHPTSKDKP